MADILAGYWCLFGIASLVCSLLYIPYFFKSWALNSLDTANEALEAVNASLEESNAKDDGDKNASEALIGAGLTGGATFFGTYFAKMAPVMLRAVPSLILLVLAVIGFVIWIIRLATA